MKSVLTCLAVLLALLAPAQAAPGDDAVLQARDALKAKDKARLATLKAATAGHPLAPWVDYWELGNRLSEVQSEEVEAFFEHRYSELNAQVSHLAEEEYKEMKGA